jgi:hypothetical protein
MLPVPTTSDSERSQHPAAGSEPTVIHKSARRLECICDAGLPRLAWCAVLAEGDSRVVLLSWKERGAGPTSRWVFRTL